MMALSAARARLLLMTGAAALAGCAARPPELTQPAETVPDFLLAPQARAQGGGLFVPQASTGLVADQRAHRAGDVLTVVLEEVTQASKKANTQTNKGSNVGISPPILAGSSIKADVELASSSKFNGGGSSTQQNALTGAMTVIVQQVLPNGLLYIKGDRALSLNQGDEVLRLSGYVRATDVDLNNRVSSLRVANARIGYSGHGALSDASQAGWLTRFFQSPLFPF
ncbi:flagellar basal body L-ring protein FlgH [Comamonas guangdongensis]|uniref:Flagellar L-ring protein n=1 Tax=Comamonas guangdongensis TaxID=510515 RepID=A0ABV3ZRS1_9BURK